jgi:hypothetical protein
MSGNPNLDAQIARAVMPQFDPMQAIQQMQRPAVQMPQNPFFGGQVPIPMDFGLPEASRIPDNYAPPPRAQFQQGLAGLRGEYDQRIADLTSQISNLQSQIRPTYDNVGA